MSSSQELYNQLSTTLFALVKGTNRKQIANWIWIVAGLLQSSALALSPIATHLPMKTTAEARVTLIRRWLKNFRVEVWTFYEPILNHVFQGWHAVEAILILDGVLVFGDHWQIFRVSLRHGCRAIPLGWVVLAGKGVTSVDKLEGMLTQVTRFLRGRVKQVIFLADRGFRTCVPLPDGRFCRIDRLGVPQGQRRYFQNVLLTREAKLRTNLSVGWTDGDAKHAPELLAVISEPCACRLRLREYGSCMSMEESFRGDKLGGFEMAHTRLQHADRIERLLLALAIAALWYHELGEDVLTEGEAARRQIDPGATRELSLFQYHFRGRFCTDMDVQLSKYLPFAAQPPILGA